MTEEKKGWKYFIPSFSEGHAALIKSYAQDKNLTESELIEMITLAWLVGEPYD